MPGARNSSLLTQPGGAIEIAQPRPGTVVTNTVTVLGTGQSGADAYHIGVETGGRYLAQSTVTPAITGSTGAFTVTLRFDPVASPADGQVTVYTTAAGSTAVEEQAVVPVRLAPANVQAISGPVIQLSPDNGKAGTPVVVLGEGFPSDSLVEIRLSGVSTEATEHAYVSGRTSNSGAFKLAFTMPAFWPSGDPILAPQVLVVASTPDFVNKATAIFGYNSGSGVVGRTPLPGEQPAARMAEAFLRAWASGSPGESLSYLSADFRNRVSADGSVAAGISKLLGVHGTPGRTTVVVVSSSADETVVRVTLQGDNGASRADLTMQEDADGWQIVWIAPAGKEVQ
jgi:hypothetical protein